MLTGHRHKWIAFILCAVNWVTVMLFVPETRYARPLQAIESDGGIQHRAAPGSTEEHSPLDSPVRKTVRSQSKEMPSSPPTLPSEQIPKKSWRQELSLWSGIPKDTNFLELIIRPIPLVAYPAVLYSTLGYAVSLAWVLAINVLSPFVLQAPPYSWKASVQGLINIPGLIGNVLGAWLGGWLVDRYSDWRSRKNGGIFQPETRLHLLVIPTLLVPAGCLAFGYGVADALHWTSLFFGYGMIALGLTFQPVSTMAYVSDAYLPVNMDAFVLINGVKNIVAFGFLYGVSPWVEKDGYVNAFGAQAGIYVLVMLLGAPLVFTGAKIRKVTADWRIIV